jgi:putative hydrolase of the HAD superfamily
VTTPITTVISDFGGVLTNPLWQGFAAVQEHFGIPPEALGTALAAIAERDGAHPLYELECGRMTEAAFFDALDSQLSADLGRAVGIHSFSERYWAELAPNAAVIDYLTELRDSGYRLALLTNNVREWEPRWRAMLPVDELFELVVDSAFVGMRKPDPEIYALTCERLAVEPAECAFLDDFAHNCDAARELGMTAVCFQDDDQAIGELRAILRERGAPAHDRMGTHIS